MKSLLTLWRYRKSDGDGWLFRGFKPSLLHKAFAGYFEIASEQDGDVLQVLATNGDEWDHVSVSRRDRCPTWEEMEQIKRLFFMPNEIAMQLHVAEAEHISHHPYCLHIWRPHGAAIPQPPALMVA